MTFDSSISTTWDSSLGWFQFLIIEIFEVALFYNIRLNVNIKLLQIALLEPTLYWIYMPLSYLKDLTPDISNDSLKQNQQLASTVN